MDKSKKITSWTAIYVLWLREMKRFIRSRSRIFGMVGRPLFFLVFLGLGFKRIPVTFIPGGVDYLHFLVPGVIGMTMLFSSMFAGISVLWDREFGFLKEIMVAPVSRVSIVLGRMAGGTTTGVLQGIFILSVSLLLGFKITGAIPLIVSVIFMILISATFIGLGLIFASQMKDIQGFSIVMNFIILPLFFLSGALFPLENLPVWIRYFSYIDPLTYGVDGLRGALIGVSSLPILFDFIIIAGFAVLMVLAGAYLFEKSEAV
ncbi:MAG TPA: multidrug ABC transporter permease [Candidatus Omnitrophica bacterium]|nr:multidrug ABC transporter permease [Candidatus Omnitrophota bacterium]